MNMSLVVNTAKIEEKVKIERAIIGPDCIIKKGAKVVNSVLLKGVTVEAEYS